MDHAAIVNRMGSLATLKPGGGVAIAPNQSHNKGEAINGNSYAMH